MTIVSAQDYLREERYVKTRRIRVFNLCKSYKYQTFGYYVSLLGEARGHKPIPTISTVQGLKSGTLIRIASEELEDILQKSLAHLQSDDFTLSIYFGKNVTQRYDRLAHSLFKLFHAPLMRAHFIKNKGKWIMQNINPVSTKEIDAEHWGTVIEAAQEYFTGRRTGEAKEKVSRYDLAILRDSAGKDAPSNKKALQRFIRAAESLGFYVELIDRTDFGRLAEFDALFIRETTSVNHHTYRFATRAKAEGLVVIDDPETIFKCSNKVFLTEILDRHKMPTPKTALVQRKNYDPNKVIKALGLPIILKQPDSAFSLGVSKANTKEELIAKITELHAKSDIIIGQEFMQTDFDWRIGIIDRTPLFASKYFMAKKHWQIVARAGGKEIEGDHETLAIEDAPPLIVETALKAANLIGDGLFGVDMKEVDGKPYVIEVNDNPNIDAGVEDEILKKELYSRIISVFAKRIDKIRHGENGQ